MNRRDLLKMAAQACGGLLAAMPWSRRSWAADTARRGEKRPMASESELTWRDVREWGVEGKGWTDTEAYFDRLPARAKGVVREPVWNLSRQSAGMSFQFETDATEISARWTLRSNTLAMGHMPATGVSGLDLYAQDEQGRFWWVAIGNPPTAPKVQLKLAGGLKPGRRTYRVYLPLYNGVTSVEVSVPPKAAFQPIPPRQEPPVVFYGTSIMQGGCASRPGMAHSAILGRRLNRPIINLGFSGNGIMEPEVAALLAELNPCVYVIDCLPNMEARLVAERAEPLVQTLRKAHPTTPVVLVEDRTYTDATFLPARRDRNLRSREALRKAHERLLAAGVGNLHYVPGEHLLGDDGEAAVDGSHPTDLGFMRMADALEPVLRPLI
ncbi:MAG: twin-arginine translocation signal domain-containing protein [Planctomycetes bacterium]|nr:twin-arginine translocation signal domain-containing protein [Planctomycetota bacterium]